MWGRFLIFNFFKVLQGLAWRCWPAPTPVFPLSMSSVFLLHVFGFSPFSVPRLNLCWGRRWRVTGLPEASRYEMWVALCLSLLLGVLPLSCGPSRRLVSLRAPSGPGPRGGEAEAWGGWGRDRTAGQLPGAGPEASSPDDMASLLCLSSAQVSLGLP